MSIRLGARAQAVIVLALVALTGALAGILAERALAQQQPAGFEATGPRPMRGPGGPMTGGPMTGGPMMGGPMRDGEMRYAERLAGMLDLTAAQQAAIDTIMTEQRRRVRELTREVEPRFQQIAQDARQRVEAVLTDEQREELRTLRRDRMRGRGMQPAPGRRP
jgi:Spy/CpxP family protein refolding chaperone